MDLAELSAARGQIHQILQTVGPILRAAEGAQVVLDALTSASKHKTALEADVADLKAQVDATAGDLEQAKAKVKAAKASAVEAEAAAAKRVDEAAAVADARIAELKTATERQLGELNAQAIAARDVFNAEMAAMASKLDEAKAAFEADRADKEVAIASLEKKLTTLRGNVQKLAAALGE